jgi:site-specific recombinase XerD
VTTAAFDEWIDEWDLILRSGTVVDGTRVVYMRGVRQFLTWLLDSNPQVGEPAHVTGLHVAGWLGHLTTVGRSEATRRVRLLAVTFWFDYMRGEVDSGVTTNPCHAVALPVPKEKPVPVIPDDELIALLATCKPGAFTDRRDEAMLRLMLDTGIRRAELVGIDLADLDLGRQEATVTGKGGNQRVVPFGAKTAVALRKYKRARASRPYAEHPALFQAIRPSDRGEIRLSGNGVGEMVDRRCRLAGIQHRWPHQLRHTWAHDLLDNGANEGAVERLGGWSPGSKMVKRYGSSLQDERARKTARNLSRGDRV